MESCSSFTLSTFVKRNLVASSGEIIIPPSVPLVLTNNRSTSSQSEESTGDSLLLQIVPESIELLRSIGKPLAVIAICGPYRTGKSYFLSQLLGESEYFKVSHSTETCTRGIWMATTVLECNDFVVVFLDTEGISAVDGSTQASTNFLITTALTSSLLIYNTRRPLQLKDIEKLR